MHNVLNFRQIAQGILKDRIHKKIVVCGPCSIHDISSTLQYAKKLKVLHDRYHDHLFIIMRVFLEKPRTTNNWRGFLNDPHRDGSNDLENGIALSKQLLSKLNSFNLPLATEFIDPNLSSLTKDFFTWGFIGARTVRSPTHRQLAAFLDMPCGFKNPLDGDLDALYAAVDIAKSHHKAYMASGGTLKILSTEGNHFAHAVLRGSNHGPNYKLAKDFTQPVLIDCAHGNSSKTLEGMKQAFRDSMLLSLENPQIKGMMLESFLHSGKQTNKECLIEGISITDPCLGMDETQTLLDEYYRLVSQSHGSSSGFNGSALISGSSSEI